VSQATFRIWRSEPGGGSGAFTNYTPEPHLEKSITAFLRLVEKVVEGA